MPRINHPKLMTPGPVELHPRVLNAVSKRIIHHRSNAARSLIKSIVGDLKAIHGVEKGSLVIGAGSGTSAIDSIVWSLVDYRDRVLVVSHGEFGNRLANTLSTRGAGVKLLSSGPGNAISPSDIEEAIRDINVLALVYNETSTGLLYRDLETISKRLCGYLDLIIVDAVSAIAAAPMNMEKWCIDAVGSAPHKAIAGPPGVYIVAVSREALGRVKGAPPSLDLGLHAKMIEEKGETPFTPPLNILYGIREALDIIHEAGGLDAWIKMHVQKIKTLYNVVPLEYRPLVQEAKYRSNNIAALKLPPHLKATNIISLLEEVGYRIAPGMGSLKEQVIRIGVMGYIGIDDVVKVGEVLREVIE